MYDAFGLRWCSFLTHCSYWQIEVDEEAKPKSAFICRSGLYEFVRMPFGLTNAPATMQRLMDSVLAGLKWQICLVYLDDIICYSPSFEQHLVDLRSVLLRLRAASLTANLKKCKFASNRISFLGYVITPDGLHTDPEKALTSAPVLRFPDFSRPFELHTDGACTAGIGVILCQRDPRNNRAYAVAFASRSLSPAERNYGVSEVEALAIFWGIKKFAHYLTGTKFTVVTDHHSLQFLNKSKSTDLRGRLARWTLLLQQHDFEIVYRPGSKNAGPDALSRYPVPARVSANTYICSLQASDLASAQAVDPYCQELLRGPLPEGFSLEPGILFFGPRPVLPASMQDEMFELLHSNPTSGHLGIGRTVQRFYKLYFFPGLKQWVTDKVNKCGSCQRIKRDNKTFGYTKLVHTDPPAQPFDTIAIDTFGPLPISRAGNRYVIVIQCLFSRYVCLFAVPENNDVNVVNCLSKVIGEHGLFRVVMSDNGSPYSGTLLKSLAAHLNVQQRFCPAYHAASNGLVERFMETLKNMLSSYLQVNQNQNTWDTHLPEFQFAYNSTPHQATKYTPFSVEHDREARLLAAPDFGVKNVPPGDHYIKTKEFVNRAYDVIKLENIRSQASNALNFNGQRKAPTFALNDLVLVNCPVYSKASLGRSNKLSHRYRGPFSISEVLSSDRYNAVEISNGKVMKNIHASRLKEYNHNEDIAQCNNPDVVSV
ncbi:hypothetical protein G6F37_011201 [Rhizopus arrhizus]|nr:hypothetical protein G6F38_011297 [Rhizopus arrhizus]KAG1150413.1 hypothetical protein G6F37_011201 [Rhizopus arrhizus]